MSVAPVLRLAAEMRLRHAVWYAGEYSGSCEALLSEFGLSPHFVKVEGPGSFYRCFRYVGGVKLWTSKRPLVLVSGDSFATWMAAAAGRWGGGELVYLDDGNDQSGSFMQRLVRRRMRRKARYAFCPGEAAVERLQRNAGCIIVDTRACEDAAQATVDALLRWTGGADARAGD